MRCAVIGLGEVGSQYAEALRRAGNDVVGHDEEPRPGGVPTAPTVGEAVAGADVVLVMTTAAAAPEVAAQAAPRLSPSAVYADCTSAPPAVMRELCARIESAGARFVDVAILGQVAAQGTSAPVMLAGSGAAAASEVFAMLGADVEVLDGARPGEAMAHKLLRSIFMKGMAAVIGEALDAADAVGLTDWTRGQIADQLAGDGQAAIDRFLSGSRSHAVRRAQEMRDTADYLTELGVAHTMSSASAAYLEGLARRVTDAG